MTKIPLVIASILKPVNDTRLFEKFAFSLDQTSKYEINIIGFLSKKLNKRPSITFHPLFNFQRLSLQRLGAPIKYYISLLKLNPKVIIVTTPELLIVSCLYKILFGAELYYDVQENYFRNCYHTSTYPPLLRLPLALGVRAIEYITRPFITHYFLAEKCYQYEMKFHRGKSSLVLNKFKPLSPPKRAHSLEKRPLIRLLYTGTIAKNYGILEGIDFTKNISSIYPQVSLKIIGFAPDKAVYDQVKEAIKDCPCIELVGGNTIVPHEMILRAISEADFALMPYQPDKSIENCFPTKIWEYMAYQLPMIIQNHDVWVKYCSTYHSCIPIDFKEPHFPSLIQRMLTSTFYPKGAPEGIFWDSEEHTLLQVL